ncbi:hypothetical protein J2S89_002509 [Arthrobacter bambusae]|nr:hypothetical protein [Arthrobacter bambusae]MDQ0099038.1 hypothetical protein [Arthrobacter bambusae]
MSTVSESAIPHEPHQPGTSPLWCAACGTDKHLVIESIQAQGPRLSQQLAVFYTCTSCGLSYSHAATVQQAGAILNRRGIQDGPRLLEFGKHYFHCGEPLREVKTSLRRFGASRTGRPRLRSSPPEALLHTKVLRCSCGFELEIPA